MAVTRPARSVRSSDPSGSRRPDVPPRPGRPELRVVEGGRAKTAGPRGLATLVAWMRTRSVPLVHVAVAVGFLVATLLGALMLRTQMVQHSFEMSALETRIERLTQDVGDEQARLDRLEASLPQKATDLGMEPPSSSVTIDLGKAGGAAKDAGSPAGGQAAGAESARGGAQ